MKKILHLLVTLFSIAALRAQAETINQTIARLNADSAKPGGADAVLKSISKSTHVPVATLEKEKSKAGLSYGELYIAHAIATASGKPFDAIAALKAKGESWDKIADENGVSLGGKKVTQKPTVAAKPSPTPPQKTLRQEQAERLSH